MPIETLEGSLPPTFKRGQSPRARFVILVALALFLMVADARFHVVEPLRAAIATALYPAQWLALQPVQWTRAGIGYVTDVKTLRKTDQVARRLLLEQSTRAGQVEQLELENRRLRALLDMRSRVGVAAQAAQVLYDATDPYSRRVVIDKGQMQGIQAGSPVVDEFGILGQVTRVYPLMSEVTLLTDSDQVVPVVDTRTGKHMVVHGDATRGGVGVELRYVGATDDIRAGDLLATSGIDGVYPPGLPVARVDQDAAAGPGELTRVPCTPLAQVGGVAAVLVLAPVQLPPVPAADAVPGATPAQGPDDRQAKAADSRRNSVKVAGTVQGHTP